MEKLVEIGKLQIIPGKRFLIRDDRPDEFRVIRMDSIKGGYAEDGKIYVRYDSEPSG